MLLCAVSVPLTLREPDLRAAQVPERVDAHRIRRMPAAARRRVRQLPIAAAANVAVERDSPSRSQSHSQSKFPVTFPDRFPLIVCVNVLLPVQLLFAASRLLLLLVMSDTYASDCSPLVAWN